jgi:hypothetical protein
MWQSWIYKIESESIKYHQSKNDARSQHDQFKKRPAPPSEGRGREGGGENNTKPVGESVLLHKQQPL